MPPPTASTPRYIHGQAPPSYNQQPPAVRNYAGNFSRVPNPFSPTTVPPPRVSPIPYPNPPRGAPIPYPNPPPPQPHPSSSHWTGTYIHLTPIMTGTVYTVMLLKLHIL